MRRAANGPDRDRRLTPIDRVLCNWIHRLPLAFATVVVSATRRSLKMQLIFGAVFVLIAVVIVPRLRVPNGVSGGALGFMSEQWLAEYRGSHSA